MTDTRDWRLIEASADAMWTASWHIRIEQTGDSARLAEFEARADAAFATLVAVYRPTDPAPLRALLEKLAASVDCNVIGPGGV